MDPLAASEEKEKGRARVPLAREKEMVLQASDHASSVDRMVMGMPDALTGGHGDLHPGERRLPLRPRVR